MMRITDTFRIKGRGLVACVESDGPCPLNGSELRRVSDGAVWKVNGVERFNARMGTVGEAGEKIGILLSGGDVDPATGDELVRVDVRPLMPPNVWEEWFDFLEHHRVEVLSLAISALGRFEKPRRGPRPRRELGPTQQKIVTFVKSNPRCRLSEIAESIGVNYNNLRRMMPVLESRELIHREHEPGSNQMLWLFGAVASELTQPQT